MIEEEKDREKNCAEGRRRGGRGRGKVDLRIVFWGGNL
jgi:hypothetical protein